MTNTSTASKASREDLEERNRVSSYRGYLFKLRRSKNLLAPQWGRRWITIEGHFLKWYRQEMDVSPSGMIDLKYIRSIHKLDSGPAFAFVITCEERTLVLRCTSKNEMNSWIRALHIQADIARGGSGMMVVSDFNQIPLDFSAVRYGGPKNRNSTTSLTLEQELDLTLQKLQELEVKAQNQEDFVEEDITDAPPRAGLTSVAYSRNSSHSSGTARTLTKESSGSKAAAVPAPASVAAPAATTTPRTTRYASPRRIMTTESDDLEDSTGSVTDVPIRVPKRGPSIGGGGGGGGGRDRSLAREESNNSIEDISLEASSSNTKAVRTRGRGFEDNFRKPTVPVSPEEVDEFDISDSSPPIKHVHVPVSPASPQRLDYSMQSDSTDMSDTSPYNNTVRPMRNPQVVQESSFLPGHDHRAVPIRQSTNKTQKSLRSAWDNA